ncbi:MAG: lamin tail domain-containing protein, partial [Thermoplasmata archaeon]|nr:lamin tail domain-containing protein [Thermoplasmata archaeon]
MTRALLFAGVLLFSAFSLQAFSSQADLHTKIVLNEVVYNPRGLEVEGEWIELFNDGESVDIQDWTITDQDNWIFQFPSLAVPRECYIVLHIGPGIPDSDFSDCVAHLYANKTTPRLNNAGDDLLLQDGQGAAIDFFSYGSGSGLDHPPPEIEWTTPATAVPEGYSSSVFPNGYGIDSHQSWMQSNPSPGESNGELSGVSTEMKVTEVYYNAHRDNEYVAITSFSPYDTDISGWQITDLEGRVAFPSDTVISPHCTFWVTRNSTSFLEDALFQAHFQYESGDVHSMVIIGNIPQLNNDGDEVLLLDDKGRVVDAFVYGYSGYEGPGWEGVPANALMKGEIAKRESDTNSSADWESLRDYGIGQSDFDPELIAFEGSIVAFSSPDTSYDVIVREIEGAEDSISINVYEFTNKDIANALLSALARGVSIRILLDGSPVGGVKTTETEVLDILSQNGAAVRLLKGDESQDIHSRYTFNHGKYALLDGDTTIVCSENWGDSGIPANNRTGNRGWGMLVRAEEVHDYFEMIFESDWNPQSRDSVAYQQVRTGIVTSEPVEDIPTSYEYVGAFPDFSKTGSFRVRPAISPDTSLDESTVLNMIRSADEELLVEQFYIRPNWGSDKSMMNPYLEEVVKAARRGIQVYVLLDSSWYNTERDDPYDNDNVVAYLNALNDGEGLPIQAKLINSNSHGYLKLHNKGLIADGEEVLISSINWNKNSITSNREIGIIVYDADVASFYRELFFYDWKDDVTSPFADAGGPRIVTQNEDVLFDGSSSFDDVGIVNFSWDLDGDGSSDRFDAQVKLRFTEVGNFTVTLMVEDAWGNVDEDICLVQVLAPKEEKPPSDDMWGGLVLMTV